MHFPHGVSEQQQHHHHLPVLLPPPTFQVPLQLVTQAPAAAPIKHSSNWIGRPTFAPMPVSSAAAFEPQNLFVQPRPIEPSKAQQMCMAAKVPTVHAHTQFAYAPGHSHTHSFQPPTAPVMAPIYTTMTRATHDEFVTVPPRNPDVLHCHQSHAPLTIRPSAAAHCISVPKTSSLISKCAAPITQPSSMLTAPAVSAIPSSGAFGGDNYAAPVSVPATSIAPCNTRYQHHAINGGGKSPTGQEHGNNNKKCDNGDCWSTAVTGWEQAAIIKNKIGLLINGRFRILQSIASGSYGEIFAAEDLHQRKHRVAVKFDGACRDNHLRYEYQVYKSALYEDVNGKVDGFPQVYWYGHEYGHNILVMELLGAPVASLFAFCDRKFARQTIVSLGEQMIHRIRHLHQRGFIHRDIKPENFLMGLDGKESTLYLIDFGLARRYRYRENRALTHIPFRRGRNFIGTAKYASLNSHKNIELSRRDDVESLAYVLIELINGHLPWKNISKRNATTRHQTSLRIRTLKEQTNWEEFCPSMAKFIRYCREIPFNEEPDYDRLLGLLRSVTFLAEGKNKNLVACAAPLAAATRNRVVEQKSSVKSRTGTCCRTPKTAEKMTQVDFETSKIDQQCEEEGDYQTMRDATNGIEGRKKEILASTLQCLSLNGIPATSSVAVACPGSDADEIGAATTTTSCSDNELVLDSAVDCVAGKIATELCFIGSAVSDGDDELTVDSQSELQQNQPPPPVCRKCRRLRDQKSQQKRSQPHGTASVSPVPTRVEQSLQTEHKHLQQMASSQRKMCWQQARDSNPERRFQYENRFSWTVDKQQQQQLQQQHNVQGVHLPPQQRHEEQLAPNYQIHVAPALPLEISHMPSQIASFHTQQPTYPPSQFVLQPQQQQPKYCTNGQIPLAYPFGVVMPNSTTSAPPPAAVHFPPFAQQTEAAGPAPSMFPPPQAPLPVHAALASRPFVLASSPLRQPCSMTTAVGAAAQCSQRPRQQHPPLAPPAAIFPATQPPRQQQKGRRFMHIAFVLPPAEVINTAQCPTGQGERFSVLD